MKTGGYNPPGGSG